MDLTVLEVHLDEATFTANAPLSGESEAPRGGETPDDGDGGSPLLAFVVGLVTLAVLGYLVRRWRSSGSLDPDISDGDTPTP